MGREGWGIGPRAEVRGVCGVWSARMKPVRLLRPPGEDVLVQRCMVWWAFVWCGAEVWECEEECWCGREGDCLGTRFQCRGA